VKTRPVQAAEEEVEYDEDAEEGDDDEEDEEEDEAVVEESPKTSKGKTILRSLTSPFKRKQEDRSPEAPSSSKPKSRFTLVGVVVPPPPLPHSSYLQLSKRTDTSPLATAASTHSPSLPPVSATPSLISFDSQGSGTSVNFDAERYRTLYRMSQESLALQQAQHEEELAMTRRRQMERERRRQEEFDFERTIYESKITALEQAVSRQNEASGSSSRGGDRRR
jgi:hypothetical protein